ncbi:hypothetical protein LRS74_07185 [Streptomyces sp. LX-29]|uniref:hypothetical protein n=1 Tax=Streptomyces sp. LX-29 TaxID=2900152 RepID=UPI00240DF81F|nr:hypothetical protein [Streptomyces sp. LX-29]WFB06850.1 hypothetical protein LRS74_07185 [Streptomyces sp. LX-29]
MPDSVPVRCPVCRHEQSFTPPTFPCACGAPLTLPLSDATPQPVRHRTWLDSWVAVRCPSCRRLEQWPQPELGCPCGTVLRVPVVPAPGTPDRDLATAGGPGATGPASASSAVLRPAFRPVTIRTARDAITAAGQYLKWLGFSGMRRPEDHTASGVDLCGPGIVAQIDPTTRPTGVRDVECLWLNGLNDSAIGVFFSLAGYSRDARRRADELRVPLFVMDLTGTPQPVNDAADDLIRMGPPEL